MRLQRSAAPAKNVRTKARRRSLTSVHFRDGIKHKTALSEHFYLVRVSCIGLPYAFENEKVPSVRPRAE